MSNAHVNDVSAVPNQIGPAVDRRHIDSLMSNMRANNEIMSHPIPINPYESASCRVSVTSQSVERSLLSGRPLLGFCILRLVLIYEFGSHVPYRRPVARVGMRDSFKAEPLIQSHIARVGGV